MEGIMFLLKAIRWLLRSIVGGALWLIGYLFGMAMVATLLFWPWLKWHNSAALVVNIVLVLVVAGFFFLAVGIALGGKKDYGKARVAISKIVCVAIFAAIYFGIAVPWISKIALQK
jgi:hypothetical protein